MAQQPDTSIFTYPIQMDEVTVAAARGGWDVQAFIRRVKTDTTFEKAFRTLHLVNYTAVNDIAFYNKKGMTEAVMHSETRQTVKNRCRTMEVLSKGHTGNYYKKNGEPRHFTAELYEHLFFTKGTICNENNNMQDPEPRGAGSLEKAKYLLKQLIFSPGSKVSGVPLMGNRASVFEPGIAKKYDFRLSSTDVRGIECWAFAAIPKAGEAGSVAFRELTTWFRKSDYAIVARTYNLAYDAIVYDFDVNIRVDCTEVRGQLLPKRMEFDGTWHVSTQGRETSKFVGIFSY